MVTRSVATTAPRLGSHRGSLYVRRTRCSASGSTHSGSMRATSRAHSRDVSTSSGATTHARGRLGGLGRHDPCRRPAGEGRAGEDLEARVAGALVLAALLVLDADVRQQAGQHRDVHLLGLGGVLVGLAAALARGGAQLADEVLPLAHAQVVQVLLAAALAELVAGE